MVAQAFNPSTWEAEASRSLWVRGQPGLQELVSRTGSKAIEKSCLNHPSKINKKEEKWSNLHKCKPYEHITFFKIWFIFVGLWKKGFFVYFTLFYVTFGMCVCVYLYGWMQVLSCLCVCIWRLELTLDSFLSHLIFWYKFSLVSPAVLWACGIYLLWNCTTLGL